MKITEKINELKNIRHYVADILILTIFCFLGFIFSEKPHLNLSLPQKKTFYPEKKLEENENDIKRHKLETKAIMERNLFTVDGRYSEKIQVPPENPYSLVAVVISGKEKRAILKDFTGEIFIAKEKEKMIDGYIIEKIDKNSVILKRGKQKKELKILSSKRKEIK
uniref:Uncharacterized protein n=1 Tax=Thermodesulfobacterium geofontis TaxID=1295609 RepID=A0A7C4JQ55_9BACT